MSEYQYYEFAAIDRPLTDRQMGELREISTRADITPTSFVNEYQWGDLKADPQELLAKYFDAFLYFANWGTRRCMFRVPRELAHRKAWQEFAAPEALDVTAGKHFVVVDFWTRDESGQFDPPYGLKLAALLPVRSALMEGDLGPLYVGWLAGVVSGDVQDEAPEPCDASDLVPASAVTATLADFLCVTDLWEAIGPVKRGAGTSAGARRSSGGNAPTAGRAKQGGARAAGVDADSTAALRDRLASLPAEEKDALLARLLTDPPNLVRAQLARRLRPAREPGANGSIAPRRTAEQLLRLAGYRG